MLKTLIIYEIRSFRGLNIINLSTERRISALLGPNGSGKTTLLTALAFVLGSGTIEGNEKNSCVEAIFEDGIHLKRDVQDYVFINGEETTLQAYMEFIGSKVAFLKNHLDENLQNTFNNPVSLLDYVDAVIRKQEDKDWASLRAQEYLESKAEEEKSRLNMVRARSSFQKLKTQLKNMDNAKLGQENVRISREGFRDAVFSIDVSKYLLCCVKLEIVDVKTNSLTQEAILIGSMIEKEHESLSRTSAELKEINTDLANCTNECILSRKALAMLSDKHSRVEISKVQLESSMQIINFERDHQNSVASSLQARIECHERFMKEREAPQINIEETYQRYLIHQANHLRQSVSQLAKLRGQIEVTLSGLVPQLFLIQNESTKEYTVRIERETRKIQLESQLSKLKTEIDSAKDVVTAIDCQRELTAKFSEDEWISQAVSMLKTKFPRIIGIAQDFVKLRERSSLSKEQFKEILNTILRKSKKLGVVVENDDDAIQYSKQINSLDGFRIDFLPRKLKFHKQRMEGIPSKVKKSCPSVFWLSDSLVTDLKEESHLAHYVACDYLLVPDEETFSLLLERWDISNPVCDFNGQMFRNVDGFSEFKLEKQDEKYLDYAKTTINCGFQDSLNIEKSLQEIDTLIDSDIANSTLKEGLESTLQTFVAQLNDLKGRVGISVTECSRKLEKIEQIKTQMVSKCNPAGVNEQDLQNYDTQFALIATTELESLRIQHFRVRGTEFEAMEAEVKSSLVATSEKCRQLGEEQDLAREKLNEQMRLQSILREDAFRYEQYIETNKNRPLEMENAQLAISRAIEELHKEKSILALEKCQIERELLAVESCQHTEKTICDIRESVEISNETNDIERLFNTKAKLVAHIEQLILQKRRYETIIDEARNSNELEIQYSKLLQKVREAQTEHLETREQHKRIEQQFKRLHIQKLDRIKQFVEVISPLFEEVYKSLYAYADDTVARACLELVDDTDVDQGISISAFPGNKPYTEIACLSAGEFTLVYLAFEIALALAQGKSYFLFDELDSPMDAIAVNSLARCVVQLSKRADVVCSMFLATHQRRLYLSANQIIGLFKIRDTTSIIVAEVKNILYK